MGAKTGKLAFDHTSEEPKDGLVAVENLKTNAAAHVNGDADKLHDVPLIDSSETSNNEPNSQKSNGQNGTVGDQSANHHASEGETTGPETPAKPQTKKHKNPVKWIQRRVSQKFSSISGKKTKVESKPSEQEEPTATGDNVPPTDAASPAAEAVDQVAVESTADQLVQEALDSCETKVDDQSQPSESTTQQEPVSVLETESSAQVQHESETPTAEQPVLNGEAHDADTISDEAHAEEPVAECIPVDDSNNTNSVDAELPSKLADCGVIEPDTPHNENGEAEAVDVA